ncbi:hypothetical protein VC83_03998 [Pseudogymnoascus destructans]|uniref:Large ribosomal subunit protein bL32m n=1 Tax=Pseudogymnoascus destructans TaxID=655981 RepID=A0A177ACK9_9PEZI|nr:uncharacterized protein VC83_03998 [Pseudogymnoascus destructans]OAF59849.2 hypothetical protein VC83_03998 [Pseudogymnoascus destructans]
MAAVQSTSSILSFLLPRLSAPAASAASRSTTLFSRYASTPILPTIAFAIPASIRLNVPSLLGDIWESVLRAVPKKKTSHMKKRSRFMAGKGLKDVTEINKCSACGHVKRAHLLCPYCVKGTLNDIYNSGGWNNADISYTEIQDMFKATMKKASGTTGTTKSE